jgi:hypothetical protein
LLVVSKDETLYEISSSPMAATGSASANATPSEMVMLATNTTMDDISIAISLFSFMFSLPFVNSLFLLTIALYNETKRLSIVICSNFDNLLSNQNFLCF